MFATIQVHAPDEMLEHDPDLGELTQKVFEDWAVTIIGTKTSAKRRIFVITSNKERSYHDDLIKSWAVLMARDVG